VPAKRSQAKPPKEGAEEDSSVFFVWIGMAVLVKLIHFPSEGQMDRRHIDYTKI
jgi:hypothetical protein